MGDDVNRRPGDRRGGDGDWNGNKDGDWNGDTTGKNNWCNNKNNNGCDDDWDNCGWGWGWGWWGFPSLGVGYCDDNWSFGISTGSWWGGPYYGYSGWCGPTGGVSVGYCDDNWCVGLGTSVSYGCGYNWGGRYDPCYRYSCYTYPTYCYPSYGYYGGSYYNGAYYYPSSTIVVIDDDQSGYIEPPAPSSPETSARDAFIGMAAGWDHLQNGRAEAALRYFSHESAEHPRDPYAKIGYALSAAFLNDAPRGTWAMRRAFRIADESLADFPVDQRLRSVMEFAESRYEYDAEHASGRQRRDALFMVASLRFLMHDDQGAIDAAYSAEGAGDDDQSLRNLIRLLELAVRPQPS